MSMTTLHDCLREVMEKGTGFFIRSYAIPGAYRTSEWVTTTLLTELQNESPGVLEDHAWTEWSQIPGVGTICFIHYGFCGFSPSHREVPGYGHLRVLEQSHQQAVSSSAFAPLLLHRR
jgi:hypothetical protein